jgi:hypothetical protein
MPHDSGFNIGTWQQRRTLLAIFWAISFSLLVAALLPHMVVIKLQENI